MSEATIYTGFFAQYFANFFLENKSCCQINGPTFLTDPGLFPPGWKASGTGSLVGGTAFDEYLRLKITTFGL